MTDEEIAKFLGEQQVSKQQVSKQGQNVPNVSVVPRENFETEEVSPLDFLTRAGASFGDPALDYNSYQKFLKKRGFDTKIIDDKIYARKKGSTGKWGNVDPFMPSNFSEVAKDLFYDLGDAPESILSSIGTALGTGFAAETGGMGYAAIPAMAGIGGGIGREVKQKIGKLVGSYGDEAPSSVPSAVASNALFGLIPMGLSAKKATVKNVATKLMGNYVPAEYASAIGLREFAKQDPAKAKELAVRLIKDGVWGKRSTLDKIAKEGTQESLDAINEVLSKSSAKIGWQDVASKMWKNLEEKGATLDPASEQESLINFINLLKTKGTKTNPGLMPVGTKQTLQEAEKTKRLMNEFIGKFYKKVSLGQSNPKLSELAEQAGEAQSVLRDMIRDLSGNPELIKELNQKLLSYNVLGKGVEGLEGKEFLRAVGTGSTPGTFTGLSSAIGGAPAAAKYRLTKSLLDNIDFTPLKTGASVLTDKAKNINPYIGTKKSALIQMLLNYLVDSQQTLDEGIPENENP